MLAYDRMDELSREFGRELFLAFPDWERLAKDSKDEKTGAYHLDVDIPQEGSDRQLRLSTADDEITISFDRWHTHVGPFLQISSAEAVATAIYMIEAFVAEETIVTVSWREGLWIGSGCPYVAAPGKLEPHTTTQVFSWHGTYDQTIETSSVPIALDQALSRRSTDQPHR
jgi:hypothetical protein